MVQKYETYIKSRAKKQKKKNPDEVVNMTTPDGVILTISPHPLKKPVLGKKKKITTRIRRTEEPRTGFLNTRNAAKRRKRITLEI